MTFSLNPKLSQPFLKGWVYGRSLLYLSESLPLILLHRLQNKDLASSPPDAFKNALFKEIKNLLDQDIENILTGHYPVEVLLPEGGPLQHFGSFTRVLTDAVKLKERKQSSHKEFSDEAKDWSRDLPEYYTRNFHFQTDGYLSEASAELYDHQVELLFRGVSQAMRRLLLPPLHTWAKQKPPLKILEVACGTGSFTRSLALSLPDSKITAFDLSFPYLKKAQSRLSKFARVEFIQGQAEDLPFKSDQFDAVVSSYLFHELPLKVRKTSLLEMNRVLKPGGFLGVLDSLQLNDVPTLNWGLEQFPKDFHEPFYKNYLVNPMETLIKEAGVQDIQSRYGFLSKALYGSKASDTPEI